MSQNAPTKEQWKQRQRLAERLTAKQAGGKYTDQEVATLAGISLSTLQHAKSCRYLRNGYPVSSARMGSQTFDKLKGWIDEKP